MTTFVVPVRAEGDGTFASRVAAYAAWVEKLHPTATMDNERAALWFAPQSPWAPFLGRQFTDGLTASEKRRHRENIEKGNCEQATETELAGFLTLHPDLESAFQAPTLRQQFKTLIVPHHSLADRMCRAQRLLGPLVRESQAYGDDVYNTALAIETGAHKPPQKVTIDVELILKTRAVLENLALCHHYRPALKLIVQHAGELLYFETSGERGYYLLYLAQKLAIDIPNFAEIAASRQTGVSPVDVARIKAQFAKHPTDVASRKLWYRRNVCREAVPRLP
ncbi:MAG: hypothetical protein V3V97_13955 [Hyphomicrobiaceae bacterium]